MKLVNIFNNRRTLYLFQRDENGHLNIETKTGFFPYFYHPDQEGDYKSWDGVPLRKILVSEPKEVPKSRTDGSYEADILFCKRYMIDKIDELEKCPIKYAFIDIEVLSDELPNIEQAKYPVSCISVYNSMTGLIQTFWLEDYDTEHELLAEFINYMKEEKFDIWFSWNVKFDYNYLYYRIPDFAEKISIINKSRYGDGTVLYPAGISIVDYLEWFKKFTFSREKAYSLDYIAQKYLGEKSIGEVDFSKLSEELKNKNRKDVQRMVDIEKRKQIIPYYDEIRRLSKVEWEDLIWNSRILDMLLLKEARNQKIALPMKPSEDRGTLEEKSDYKGAFRYSFKSGCFKDILKLDLGCYSSDTEILTKDGWKDYKNINIGTEVATYNINLNLVEFQPILHVNIQKVKNLDMVSLKGKYTDQLLTWNHKILYKQTTRKYNLAKDWKICYAKDLPISHTILPLSGEINRKEYPISDELLKIHAWIITEGHKQNDTYRLTQSEKIHPIFCNEIRALFKKLKWNVSEYNRKGKRKGEITWNLKWLWSTYIHLEDNYKVIPLWMLEKLSLRQLKLLFVELNKGDGDKNRHCYYASNELARDRFQYLCCLIGRASYKNNRKEVYCKPLNYTSLQTSKDKKKIVKYSGTIWCPTVANGFIVVRRKGKAFISGNSAYPTAIIDFCLDPSNLEHQSGLEISIEHFKEDKKTGESLIDEKGNFILEESKVYRFKQNKEALLPTVTKKMVQLKTDIKNRMKNLELESQEYKDMKKMYDAIKSVVNSCFTPDTDIITKDGIKNIKDIKVGDIVYNVNQKTLKIEEDEIIETQKFRYKGDIYKYDTDLTDLIVTPNHKFLVQDKSKKQKTMFKTVKNLNSYSGKYYTIPSCNGRDFESQEFITILETVKKYNGKIWARPNNLYKIRNRNIYPFKKKKTSRNNHSTWYIANAKNITELELISFWNDGWEIYGEIRPKTKLSPIIFNKSLFLEFLGWFISEGSIYKSKKKIYENTVRGNYNLITITQKQKKYSKEIINLINNLGFYINCKTKKSISFCSEIMYCYLYDNCGYNSYNKKIPEYVLEESLENIGLFWKSLYKGDGNKRDKRYNTVSKNLCQDVIKLLILMGNNSIRYYKDNNIYRITWSNTKKSINNKQLKTISYNGYVYCCTTKKNHNIFAGRKGKFSLTGQSYGVFGNRFFRLYSKEVAETTTFLVRDLLLYVRNKLEEKGHSVIYVDTDSVFIDSKEDLTDLCNELIQDWAKTKYGKDDVTIEFGYEGTFEKLLILKKCRYLGYLKTSKGVEEEVKGVEAKRKDSTVFMKKFQRELIDKILNEEPKQDILKWINKKIEEIQFAPLEDIAFPCKLARSPENYKNTPIFLRALNNTGNFEKKVGEPYYYLYMEGKDETGKEMVKAFDDSSHSHIERSEVNWDRIIKRNIIMKLDVIFEAMGWDILEVNYVKEAKTKKSKLSRNPKKSKKKMENKSKNKNKKE